MLLFVSIISRKKQADIAALNPSEIQDGDLILAEGNSLQGKLVNLLNIKGDQFTHIGILVNDSNQLFVLHATPDGTLANGVRYDSLQTFIALGNVSAYQILRSTSLLPDEFSQLQQQIDSFRSAEYPFDYSFDNYDNSELYCSELIWLVYSRAGLLDMANIDFSSVIYPSNFKRYPDFELIYSSK